MVETGICFYPEFNCKYFLLKINFLLIYQINKSNISQDINTGHSAYWLFDLTAGKFELGS